VLAFDIDWRDPGLVSRPWEWTGAAWRNGRHRVHPVSSPLLRASRVQKDDRTRIVVAEVGRPDEPPHVSLEISPAGITASVGYCGVAPLYVCASGSRVRGSWNVAQLRAGMRLDDLCDRVVLRGLTRQHRYSSDTLFRTVHRLTERATATVGPAGVRVTYPEPVEHITRARGVRPGVDIVAAFTELLQVAVQRSTVPGSRVGVELSGGVDSATVALAVAAAVSCGAVRSYGLVLDGAVGREQRQRRQVILDELGWSDVTVEAREHPPFAPTGIRSSGQAHDPLGAFYREAFDALRDQAADDDITVMFSGLCGDELMALRPTETTTPLPQPRPLVPWLGQRALAAVAELDANLAPVGVLPLPTLMAFALHNPTYLDAGILPVAPLADPALLRLAEQLPVSWRRGKALLRAGLARSGLPRRVTRPASPETFSELMQRGLRRHGLPLLHGMLRNSVLIETGFVDHAALTTAYEQASTSAVIPSLLCDTIGLEVGLRSLLQTGKVTA
jgi:Asparagine synthase